MTTIRIKLPTIKQVEFELSAEYEDTQIRGSFDSGDAELDEQTALDIEEKLEWNIWAWCVVKVECKYKGLTGTDYLGGCSYEDEKDFIENSGYYEDMKQQAFDDLIQQIKNLKA